MIPATHVIMAIHPTLVLLPILGFLVLPCESINLDKGLRIGANVSPENPGCDKPLCPPSDLCTEAFYDDKKSLCYLISCPQNICENGTMTNDLLATQGPPSDLCTKTFYDDKKSVCYLISCPQNICENATMIRDLLATQESFHKNNNDGAALPHQSSGNNSLLSQENQRLRPTLNISSTSSPTNPPVFLNRSATTVSTKLKTTEAAGSKETTEGVIPTTVPTIPTKTSTPTTITTTTATTTKPLTTSTSTSVTTTVAKTTIPQQPSSPSPPWAETSASISPTVPTTPPSITSSKPVHFSPVETSTKPSPTTAKTTTLPSVVPSTPPKDNGDQSRTDQAKVEMAGDPLTIHLLNTSSLLAVLMFGLLFFVVTVALFLKQAYESYKRKDYTQVDYLINGMYSDSGV